MAQTVVARCTQCGHTNHGNPTENTNRVKYDVLPEDVDHGTGKAHGTEKLTCPQCSGSCDEDRCEYGDPCPLCAVETLHNRAGASVNRGT
jgi:hypothetical protein